MKEREAIRRVLSGESISAVARETGIVRQQLQAWVSGVRHLGLSEIQDESQDCDTELPNGVHCNSCAHVKELKSELEMIRSQGKIMMSDCSVCERISQLESDLETLRDRQCPNCEILKKKIEVFEVSQADTEKLRLSLHSLQTQSKQLQSEIDSKSSETEKLHRHILVLASALAVAVGAAIGAVARLLI
ncbi:MAG: helix-turn-helix domain-containing protein [Nitrospiraceae bacterium]|nr:helix-turn-helix domain-containing protein [Nitrospiraceae bacterium]